ncbi:MAG TPA: mannosyltransferase family protein, partial [Vicinamibacterales bacterium]|nr:mannosyltransferase family protein [Vicinamibacterales bacterium]
MGRRLGISVLLAALCMGVLATRVYEDFERVRVRLITAPRVAEGSAVTIGLAGQTGRLTGQPVAVILRVQGASEPTDVAISLDGRRLARATVPANRTIRVDTAIELLQPSAEQITVTASRSGWAVTYLELATVHGFSSGPVSLVVVPRSRPLDRLVPTWSLLPLLAALIALRPRPEWPRSRLRVLHRAGVGLVLVLFAVSLLAHVFTPYAVLLALPTFFLCAAVLYAEPLSRAWPFLRQAFLESVRSWEAAGPATERIPRWVTALDVACLIVLALLVRSMTDDDYRISLKPGLFLSLSSWPRLALWLTALLTLRYLTWRAIPWHVRVVVWLRALWRSEPLRRALPPFITSRLVVLMIGFLAVATIGFETPPVWRALDNDFLDLYGRWDSGWYYFIARNGYSGHFNPARASEIAFFPGLPLLMRGVGILAHVNFWIAGILVVVVTFLWGLTYVYRLALQDLPPDQARASLMFLAFYPFAVCYSAVLTESLFLLAAAAAFYHFRRSELWKAGVFGLVAGLLRPNGCLLSVPLALLALIPFARGRGWWLPGRP